MLLGRTAPWLRAADISPGFASTPTSVGRTAVQLSEQRRHAEPVCCIDTPCAADL